MNISRKFNLVFCLILLIVLLVACSNGENTNGESTNNGPTNSENINSENVDDNKSNANNDGEDVKLTFFNTSAEVNTVFEDLFSTYQDLNPNVTVELIPTPIGGAQLEKFQSLIASGTPATIANLDPGTVYIYKDKFLNLESEKETYENLTTPGAVEAALLDGEFLGIPWTAQGYGLLYNKRVVEEAIGGDFDPSSIKTIDDLEALFEQIDSSGVPPVLIHGADWSIGAHYLGLAYSLQSPDVEDNRKFIEDLQNGDVQLENNAQFNGLMDTFDVLKKYNIRKDDPVVADHDKDSSDFATGEVAFYFMGDWVWSTIGDFENRDEEFGVIPVPISNNPEDFGNTQIAFSEPKLFAIDNSGSTPEQQAAAKELIEWMVTSEEGQNALVADMGLSMPYKDVKAESSNVIANAVQEYSDRGDVINIGVINYLPADYWAKTGASMQKYLAGVIERNELAKEVEEYWQSTTDQ